MTIDDKGKGSVSLAPGEYGFLSSTFAEPDIVMGITAVTVKDAPVETTIDGTKSKPVTVKVDQKADTANWRR
ncbi:MAG: hypothetical protein ACRD0P_21765 [Stackebrandtia sp.]